MKEFEESHTRGSTPLLTLSGSVNSQAAQAVDRDNVRGTTAAAPTTFSCACLVTGECALVEFLQIKK